MIIEMCEIRWCLRMAKGLVNLIRIIENLDEKNTELFSASGVSENECCKQETGA